MARVTAPSEAAVLTMVHVDSSDLYKTGHMAHRWFGRLSRRLSTYTKARAPKRSGAMRAGIHTNMRAVPSAKKMMIDWRSEVPYTLYVLRGTTWPIMTEQGWNTTHGVVAEGGEGVFWHWVPGKIEGTEIAQAIPGFWMHFGGHGYPWVYRWAVDGQVSNNFLLKGWRDTAHFHRAMRRIPTFVRDP